jgi:hypothetical protein
MTPGRSNASSPVAGRLAGGRYDGGRESFIDNKATARSYLEHVVGQGNMSAADAIFEPAIQFHYPLGDLSGAGAVKDYLVAVRAAFPDIHFTIEDLCYAVASI